jgi:hypothetical protein
MNRDKRDIRHLLTGIARCGLCGARMYRGKNGGRDLYACKVGQHLVRDMRQLDAYVISHVLDRLSGSLDDLVAGDDADAAAHRALVVELRQRLADATDEYTAGRLTAGTLGRVEANLLPQIAAAEREARRAVPVPAVVFDIAGPDVEARWDALPIEGKRAVVKALFDITVLPTRTGRRVFDPDSVRIERRLGA